MVLISFSYKQRLALQRQALIILSSGLRTEV
jgi:hypothetical protein